MLKHCTSFTTNHLYRAWLHEYKNMLLLKILCNVSNLSLVLFLIFIILNLHFKQIEIKMNTCKYFDRFIINIRGY